MDEEEAEAAIRTVPDWANADMRYEPGISGVASPSHRAVDSQNWFVARAMSPASYFLKILHADQSDFIDLRQVRYRRASGFNPGPDAAPLWHNTEDVRCRFQPPSGYLAHRQDGRSAQARCSGKCHRRQENPARQHAARRNIDGVRPYPCLSTKALADAAIAEVAADGWWMRDCVGDIEAAIIATGFDEKPAHADGLASNIMIAPDGAVQLVDFDEARNVDPSLRHRHSAQRGLSSSTARCSRRSKSSRGHSVRLPQPLPRFMA